MDYNIFPQFASTVSIINDEWQVEDPVAEMTAENGWVDARAVRSRPRFILIRDIYTLVESDHAVLMAFLTGQRLRAIPFQYTHPLMGTGIVRLKAPAIGGKVAIQGSPSWFQTTIELEEQF